MKLTPIEHDPFRVARADGGLTLQRTAPFPEAPEGYEFYAAPEGGASPSGAVSGVEPFASEYIPPGEPSTAGFAPVTPNLQEMQMGHVPEVEGVPPQYIQQDELGRIVDSRTFEPIKMTPRPGLLPLARDPESGLVRGVMSKGLDLASNIMGGPVPGVGPVLGSGFAKAAKAEQPLLPTMERATEVPYGAGPKTTEAAPAIQPPGSLQPGGIGGTEGLAAAQRSAADAAGPYKPLEGLPTQPLVIGGDTYIPGPLERVHRVAEQYMHDAGLPYEPVQEFMPVSVPRAKRIAKAFEEMPHDPENPEVKASYNAMINETVAQLNALQKDGLKIEFIKPGQKDPYYDSPRLATKDLRDNNHLWVFPTDLGFGTEHTITDNPLLAKTGVVIDGRELLANDAFRIVHDYFGHFKDGVGFRAAGEENAWRSHSRMYSPLARRAMTTETRGQNSWLNYGPHGEANRGAKSDKTVYADQKIGILPDWVVNEGAADPYVRPLNEAGNPIRSQGLDAPTHPAQTVADPHRMMFPGIYENPRRIASEAAQRVAPEDPMLKQLWGVTRGDLDEMAKGRVGNEAPQVFSGPGQARGSLSAQNLQTPRNTQRLIDVLAEAGKHPGLRHMDAWYIADPIFRRMVELMGPEKAVAQYKKFNTLVGMASPSSDVLTEIARGTHAYMMNEQGHFPEFVKHAGTPEPFRGRDFPKELASVPGHPYHGTAQAPAMQKFLETGKIQSKKAKVPLYVHASGVPETGFQTSGPVGDSHFARAVGLADTRKGPSNVPGSVQTPEYHTLQPWWQHEVAGEVGLESVPAQARLWGVMGPRTGVDTAIGQSKLELLSQQIAKAAKRLGVTPEKARDLILTGKVGAGILGLGLIRGERDGSKRGGRITKVEHDPFETHNAIGRALHAYRATKARDNTRG